MVGAHGERMEPFSSKDDVTTNVLHPVDSSIIASLSEPDILITSIMHSLRILSSYLISEPLDFAVKTLVARSEYATNASSTV